MTPAVATHLGSPAESSGVSCHCHCLPACRLQARHQEFREGLTKERREEEEARRAEAEFKVGWVHRIPLVHLSFCPTTCRA